MFCNKCGNQVADSASFCNKCGNRFELAQEPPVNTSGGNAMTQTLSGIKNIQSGGLGQYARNMVSSFSNQAVLVPALVFAVTAILAGLLISLLISAFLPSAAELMDLPRRYAMSMDYKLDALSIWLISCLGGMSASTALKLPSILSLSLNASSFSGNVVALVLPALSLFIARKARSRVIDSKYRGYCPQTQDGVLAALMFTFINTVLSLFPSTLESIIKKLFYFAGMENFSLQAILNKITFGISPNSWNVFWVSLVISLLFAIPDIKAFGRGDGWLASSLTASVQYARRMWFSSICVFVFLFVYATYKMSESGVDISDIFDEPSGLAFLIIPNLSVWLIAFLTGGAISLNVKFPSQAVPFMSEYGNPQWSFSALGSGLGFIVILIGVLITAISLYPKFRDELDERLFIKKGATASVFSAVVICIASSLVSSAAKVSLKVSATMFPAFDGTYKLSGALTTANVKTFIMTALIVGVSITLIYFIRRIPAIDNALVAILSRRGMALIVTAILCLLTTVLLVAMVKESDFSNSLESFGMSFEYGAEALGDLLSTLGDAIDMLGLF